MLESRYKLIVMVLWAPDWEVTTINRETAIPAAPRGTEGVATAEFAGLPPIVMDAVGSDNVAVMVVLVVVESAVLYVKAVAEELNAGESVPYAENARFDKVLTVDRAGRVTATWYVFVAPDCAVTTTETVTETPAFRLTLATALLAVDTPCTVCTPEVDTGVTPVEAVVAGTVHEYEVTAELNAGDSVHPPDRDSDVRSLLVDGTPTFTATLYVILLLFP